MIVKSPICYDVSHHKEIADFKLVDPKPALFITKASEAYPGSIYLSTDDKFVRFFEGMISIGCVRGAYHFHRKSLDPKRQAEHFVNTISKVDILPTDFLILDVEEGGEKASQLWAWFEYVKSKFPNNRLLLYSSKNILDNISMTCSEKEYFKEIQTWSAGYPFLPDLYSKVPSSYVPDQTKYGKTVLWQYSSHGAIAGIKGDVDLNWMDQEFYEDLGDNSMAEETINFSGKCIADAKIWSSVGGQQVGTLKNGTPVSGDKRATAAGILYLHITNPVVGWTKKQWFDVSYSTTPPPPPPSPPPTSEVSHIINIYKDGKISVDNGNPY